MTKKFAGFPPNIMGKRGPKPKPTHLKVLEGNPGKRPIVPEPKPRPKPPPCPPHLRAKARAWWKRVVPELHRLGLITLVDWELLAQGADCLQTYQEAQTALTKRGSNTYTTPGGVHREYPELKMMRDARAEWIRIVSHFGLSPSARVGLGDPAAKKEDDDWTMD